MLTSLYKIADLARHRGRQRTWEPHLASGRRGEDIAHRRLQRAGMLIVARNHRTPDGSGEIDLIGWDHNVLVFIEVKARASDAYGPPERAIGTDKIERVKRAARDYVARAGISWDQVRFDTVTVLFGTPPVVEHYKDVFTIRSMAVR